MYNIDTTLSFCVETMVHYSNSDLKSTHEWDLWGFRQQIGNSHMIHNVIGYHYE